MLKFIAVTLFTIWILALVTKHTMGGFAHVLLVLAIVISLIQLVRGSD